MARHASALKAARQALRHREANRQTNAKCKNVVKKLRTALAAKTTKADAAKKLPAMLSEVQRTLKKAASKKVIKHETAARYIARLSAAVHQATA